MLSTRSIALAAAALLVLVAAPAAPAQEEKGAALANDLPKPRTFTDFNDAVAHAKDEDKFIFIACTKKNHPDSVRFANVWRQVYIQRSSGRPSFFFNSRNR